MENKYTNTVINVSEQPNIAINSDKNANISRTSEQIA